jgi:hypothetical protein
MSFKSWLANFQAAWGLTPNKQNGDCCASKTAQSEPVVKRCCRHVAEESCVEITENIDNKEPFEIVKDQFSTNSYTVKQKSKMRRNDYKALVKTTARKIAFNLRNVFK